MPLISRMVSLFGSPSSERQQIPSLRNEGEFQPLKVKDRSVSVAHPVQDILQRLFFLVRASDRRMIARDIHVHRLTVCLPLSCLTICMSLCVCICVCPHTQESICVRCQQPRLETATERVRARAFLLQIFVFHGQRDDAFTPDEFTTTCACIDVRVH